MKLTVLKCDLMNGMEVKLMQVCVQLKCICV